MNKYKAIKKLKELREHCEGMAVTEEAIEEWKEDIEAIDLALAIIMGTWNTQ